MTKGELNRNEAIEIVGECAVGQVESENCDFTNRLMDNGLVEFSASVEAIDKDGLECILTAYYYQTKEDVDAAEELDQLDWEIEGYEVI